MGKTVVMQVKRKELGIVAQDVSQLKKIQGTAFAFSLQSLDSSLNTEMEQIQAKQVPVDTPEILSYREEVQKLYDDSLMKDEKGVPLRDQENKVRLKDHAAFNKGVMEILESHPVAKAQITKHENEYNAFLEEEISLQYEDVTREDLPNDLNFGELTLIQKYWSALIPNAPKLQK